MSVNKRNAPMRWLDKCFVVCHCDVRTVKIARISQTDVTILCERYLIGNYFRTISDQIDCVVKIYLRWLDKERTANLFQYFYLTRNEEKSLVEEKFARTLNKCWIFVKKLRAKIGIFCFGINWTVSDDVANHFSGWQRTKILFSFVKIEQLRNLKQNRQCFVIENIISIFVSTRENWSVILKEISIIENF